MEIISKYWQKRIDDLAAIYDLWSVTFKEANATDEWAIYTRYSILEQRDGYTEEMQIRECEAFAERTGLKVGKIYSDRGRTGTNTDRPEYQNMQAAIKRGEYRGVLVHKVDRAFRNAEAMLSTFNNWTKKGVRFASATEMIDFTTPWGKLILAVLAMLAEIFIDNLRAETSKGKRGRFYEGIHNGPIPFGYCNGRCSRCTDPNGPGYCYRVGWPDLTKEKYAVPHPIDNEAAKHAFNLYETGAYTDEEIADALNHYQVMTEEGQLVQVRSKGKPGKGPNVFKKDMINDLLQNLFYIGKVVYYGPKKGEPGKKRTRVKEHRQGLHLPLITESQLNRVLQIRDVKGQAPQGKGGVRKPARVYLLQGLLDCFRCGKHMHSQGGSNNERRHLCSTHIQLKTACDQISVSADRLEAQLIAQWPQFRLPEDWQEDIIGYLLDDEGLHVILAQRRELQQHFDRVEQLYEDEEIDRKVYLKELRTFERRMAKLSLETRTDVDLKQARALLSDFSSLWSLMTAREQQEITQTLLKRAVVENQRIVVWHWYTPFADLFRSDAK